MRDTESGSFRLALGSFVEEYNNQVQVRWAREVVDPRRGAEGDTAANFFLVKYRVKYATL